MSEGKKGTFSLYNSQGVNISIHEEGSQCNGNKIINMWVSSVSYPISPIKRILLLPPQCGLFPGLLKGHLPLPASFLLCFCEAESGQWPEQEIRELRFAPDMAEIYHQEIKRTQERERGGDGALHWLTFDGLDGEGLNILRVRWIEALE